MEAEAQEWLDKYLDKKLRKTSQEYEIAVRSYNFVFKKGIEFGKKSANNKNK